MRKVLVLVLFIYCILSPLSFVLSWSTIPNDSSSSWSRRELFRATGVVASTLVPFATDGNTAVAIPSLGNEYNLPVATNPSAGQVAFPALTPPFFHRATFRYTLGRDAWALEQLLTFANVTATIRCNIIKLQTGGLWVHSPQWPTGESCSLLDDLEAPVEHIVLPCNALEHKAPMKAFVQKYPNAQVWIAPGQYGPLGTCGKSLLEPCNMGYRVDGILGPTTQPLPLLTMPPPWADEFDMATLYVELPKNAGPVSEVAFCHRPTKTLIATDAVIYVPGGQAPDIFGTYRYFDKDVLQDPTFWPKTVLQAVFLPLRTSTSTDNNEKYPGYEALQNRPVRAPILRALVDARAPNAVRDWIEQQTSQWDFDRILTSHFASPIQATPADVRNAFDYLFTENVHDLAAQLPSLECRDWELLDGINQFVEKTNAGAPTVFDFARGCKNY